MADWAVALIKLARVVQVKPHKREGKQVKGHTREVGGNLAFTYLQERGERPKDWKNRCDKLAFNLKDWAATRGVKLRVMAIEGDLSPHPWYRHLVAVDSNNQVHDVFHTTTTPLSEYTNKMFPGGGVSWREVSTNGGPERTPTKYEVGERTAELYAANKARVDQLKGKKEYAPGIPEKGRVTPFPSLARREQWMFGLHKHNAKKAGLHYDLRIGDPITGVAYSWAIPKATFPEPGRVLRAIRTNDHTTKYMEFEGNISSGYGAGTVKREAYGSLEIVRSRPDAIWFNLYGVKDSKPEEFLLKQIGDKSWIFMNLTVTRTTDPHIPSSKPKYKDTTTDNIDVHALDEVVQPKLDGAHVLVDFRRENKPPRVYSYRESKTGTHNLIDHTHKFMGLLDKAVPKELVGTMLRGEAVAVKDGKVQNAEVTAGLLNSSVLKSREKQINRGNLEVRIFDVARIKKKDKSGIPYSEKLTLLKRVEGLIPELKVPETATTPDDKARLIAAVKSGKHTDTDEGVVVWNTKKPLVTRAKLRPDHDVYIKGIIPGKGRNAGRAGALSYSTTPSGPVVGTIGTGFSDKMLADMWQNQKKYIGRAATIKSHKQYKSGAYRAPSFYRMHPEK